MQDLNPSQQLVVNQLLNSNKLLTEQAANAINKVTITESIGVGTIGAGSAGTIVGAGATSAAAAVIGPAVLVLGGIVVLGGLGYGGFEIWRANENDKIRKKDLEKYVTQDIESSIWQLYFKDEYVDMRDFNNFKESHTMKRDHEAIESYIKYLTESIIEPELLNDEEFQERISKYKQDTFKYIKPEYMIRFHQNLRIWCAYHKVGEFTKKDLNWHSSNWYEREGLKKRMFECFKDDLKYEKDKDGKFKIVDGKKVETSEDSRLKQFNIIRDKFYRMFKVVEYLKTENFKPEEYIALTEELNQIITDRVDPEKRKDFDLLFRKYRYLGQRAEFDRENVLNTRFYNQMYSYVLKDWNNSRNGSFAGNIAEKAITTTAITFAVEFTLIMAGIVMIEGITQSSALSAACQNGDQGACILLKDLFSSPSLQHEMCGGICH